MIQLAEPHAPDEAYAVASRQARRFIDGGNRRARPVVPYPPEKLDTRFFPVYAIDPAQPLETGEIVGLPPTGWRMMLLSPDGEVVASSEVRNGEHGFASSGFVARSPSLNRLYHRFGEVREAPGLDGRYEARFFEVPSLHVRALWLHGPRDVFIVAGAAVAGLASESEMVGIVNQVFERKASSRDPNLYGPSEPVPA
jgi:hypothetical protein